MRPSSKSIDINRRRFLRNAAGWALAGGIFVPKLIQAQAFTDNVRQYLGAQGPSGPSLPTPSGWWLLDNNGNDSSGNGATLTFGSTPTFTTGKNGNPNTALEVDPNYAYVAATACNGWTSFTWSFWFYQTGCGTGAGRFIEKGANNEITFGGNDGTCNQAFYQPLGQNSLANEFSTTSNVWVNYLINGTVGSTQNVYANGSFVSSSIGGTPASTANDIYLGTYGGSLGSYQVPGYLQDVRFWKNTLLTSTQIMQLYTAGPPT